MFDAIFRPQKFTGYHMGIVMAVFFGTIISVNLTLAWFANSSWSGLVVKNSYVASQGFDEETRRREQQIALGWEATSSYRDDVFAITLIDAAGKPVRADLVTAKIGRPVTEVDDRVLNLAPQSNGRYVVNTDLADGVWQADLSVVHGEGEIWNHAVRFTVKQ